MPSHEREVKRATVIFADAFLGSLVTLLAGSRFLDVNVEGDALPDVRFLTQCIVAGVLAGIIAVVAYLRTLAGEWLESNGEGE